jgi:hypothetical protein
MESAEIEGRVRNGPVFLCTFLSVIGATVDYVVLQSSESDRQSKRAEVFLGRISFCYKRSVSKAPKSYHLKIIPSAFSTR